jgi:alanine racemase
MPPGLRILSVVKDQAYGHGTLNVARTALEYGATWLGLSTLQEAVELREQGIRAPILLLGDRHPDEMAWCVDYMLACSVSDISTAVTLSRLAERAGRRHPVHLKVNTGMNRYGVHWTCALALAKAVTASPGLVLEGVYSHFAQSDETDKTFANHQFSLFKHVLAELGHCGIRIRHLCNSGGFLDLPQAHFDMVRLGILPLGVFPSSACRRLEGIEPVMSVKARVAAIQQLKAGETVGYGMRYKAESSRRIAVLPVGYGDGFPRVRNKGWVLIRGRRAPLVGGVAMDALTVDITEIPEATLWDEAVIMGQQGSEQITAQDVARLKDSVTYDVLTNWRGRLPRVYLGLHHTAQK